MEDGNGIWEVQIGNHLVTGRGGPVEPPAELQRVLVALLRGQELVPVARLRGGATDVALLDGQRVVKSYAGIDDALHDTIEIPAHDDVDGVRSYLRAQLNELERHDPAVRLDDDPEDLHRMRVAVRRSRAALRAGAELFDEQQGRLLRAELKWLAGRLAPLRDLDVLLAYLRREAAELEGPDRVGAERLVAGLESEREEARAEVLATLDEPRYAALLDALRELLGSAAETSSDPALAKLAPREFRKLQRLLERIGANPTKEELHRARIQAKRVRYATELSLKSWGKGGRKVVAAAKEFQDVVGEHQDAVVAEDRLRSALRRVRGVGAGVAAGRLIERERARRADARAAMPAAWKQLQRRCLSVWG